MIKKIAAFLATTVLVVNSHSQNSQYENDPNAQNLEPTSSRLGSFSTNIKNPSITNANTNKKVSKYARDEGVNKSFTYFNLNNPIKKASTYTVSLKAYIDVPEADFSSTPNNLRVYLKNTTNGEVFYKQLSFANSQQWQEFTFNFDSSDFIPEGLSDEGYNQMYIGFGIGQSTDIKIKYYLDNISLKETQKASLLALNKSVEWMQGSWGGRLYVRGGSDLDNYVDNLDYDYIAGAQEIVDNYATMGHVITNATNNANAHLYTLRNNPNVDAVMGAPNSIISEEFVPSAKNEQIIIDVIKVFKKANKKVILYLNAMSPAERSTNEGAQAWRDYVDNYFKGNEHLAWMNLCEGYVKRFAKLGVDGYWLDAFSRYPGDDSEKAAFVQMFRDVDPNLAITTNLNKSYFTDENDELLYVDSDGVNDKDESNYRIIKLDANDPYSDFTPGHITPLAQGAPPNSWAYEEYTITDVQDSPLSDNGQNKLVLKHLFSPIRETWSSERSDLLFDGEQAYRFVKNITDAGGTITFSNTTGTDGTNKKDEEAVLKYVDQQMLANAAPVKYTRPEGAYLVGEAPIITALEKGSKDLNVISKNTGIVYPSPVKDIFHISMEVASVTIFSINGTKMLEFIKGQENYDVSSLKAGFYIVEIKDLEGHKKSIYFSKE